MDKKLSIVLPCYNEVKSIPTILKQYKNTINIDENAFELILINNGSTDNSSEVIAKELKNMEYKFAKTVLIKKNQGYGHGIMTGLKHCNGDFIGYSHADLQCDPEDIFRAYRQLISYPDNKNTLIKGKRKGRSFFENFVTLGMAIFASLTLGKIFSDINAQPKIFHRSLLDRVMNPPKDFSFDLYILYIAKKHKIKIKSIPVCFKKRIYGQSHWAFDWKSRLFTIINTMRYIIKLRFEL